ncbi:MAG: hypothetical protein IPM92_00810 [Saprospiraceae bacterium]|nr:hypothetical protein [Saprospiraceae bacterium]
MRIIWLLYFSVLGFCVDIVAQDILAYYGGATYHSVKVSNNYIDFEDIFCNKTFRLYRISYNQNGLLYTTARQSPGSPAMGGGITDLKLLDLNVCDTNIVSRNIGFFWSSFSDLFVDYLGRLYFESSYNKGRRTFFRSQPDFSNIELLVDLENGTINQIRDFVIINDVVLALNTFSNEIIVLDTNYNVINLRQPDFKITGLTTKYNSCKDKKLIVSGYPYSHAVWDCLFQMPNDRLGDTLYLFEYDYINDLFTPLGEHIYPHGQETFLQSLTSFDDILSSDPECEFLLDLDRDNSSGLYPYDFKHRQIICGRDALPISDKDLYIESDLGVDSMQIRISGMKDLGAERIILADSTFKNNLRQRNDSLYSFILPGIVNVNQLKVYIQSLRYVHDGILNRTEGDRAVVIKIFAEGNVSRQAICNLNISKLQMISTDTAICYYDSLMDVRGRVHYPGDTMVKLHGKNINGCDSVELLMINSYAKEDIKITGDSIICNNSKNELCISGGKSYIWSSGGNSRCIEIRDDGEFQAKVTDQNNCQYDVQFKVSKPEPIHYELELIHPKCFGDRNGNLSVKQQNGIHEYVLGTEINTNGKFDGLASGEYILGFYDKYRCLYLDTFELLEPPEISIRYQDTIIVKDRIPELLSILDQNQNIANMKLLPEEGSRMLGKWQYEINPEKGGHYMIVATDSNGCSKEYVLVVILDLDYNVFYPNVFHQMKMA